MTRPSLMWTAPAEPWPRLVEVETGWMDDAACAFAGPEVSDRMTDAVHRDDVADLAATLCGACPVKFGCGETGRKTGGYGLWGGRVLKQGRPAPQRRQADPDELEVVPDLAEMAPEHELTTATAVAPATEPTTSPDAEPALTTTPELAPETVELTTSPSVAPEPVAADLVVSLPEHYGQRRQPRKLSRSKRLRRVATVCARCYLTSCDCAA